MESTKNDLVSIIVPVYNVEKYLRQCIESLINQTYKNIEIILVDDGSTDNSGKICDEYSKKDNRIKAIHKKNGGLSDARNYGIENAKGIYICFVDSDDYTDKKYIENLYHAIIENKADISICNFKLIFDNTKEKDCDIIQPTLINEEISNKEAVKLLFNPNSFGNYACNKMYKTELFKGVKYPKGFVMEDLGTTYKLFLKSKKIAIFNDKLYYYVQRKESILHNPTKKFKLDKYVLSKKRYYALKEIYGDFEENIIFYLNVLLETYPSLSDMDKEKEEIEKEIKRLSYEDKIFINKNKKTKIKCIIFKINKGMYCKLVNLKRKMIKR